MSQRYVAVRVTSEIGPNVYRLIGPAKEDDKAIPHPRYGWPEQVIALLKDERNYRPTVRIIASTMRPWSYLADAHGISIEEIE